MSGSGKVKVSQGERDLADLSEEQWQDYQSRYVPLEKHYAEQLDRIPDQRPLATGAAAADTAQAYDGAMGEARGAQFAAGVNPNSGRSVMGLADATGKRAAATAGATTSADQTTDDRYWGGQSQLMALGQGQSQQANLGYRATAGLDSAGAVSQASADALRDESRWNAIGTAVGVGGRYGLDAVTSGPSSGAGIMGPSKPWIDVTAGPRKL